MNIIEVPSHSNPAKFYRVDVANNRCSCPAWIFKRGGERKPCKHLLALKAGRKLNGSRIVDLTEGELVRIWPIRSPQLDI